MKLKILYNNEAKEGFISGWGFSCLIEEQNEKILFDTGADSEALLYNMDKLDVNPKRISKVVISHRHGDHTGGLGGFMKKNENKAEVIWPDKRKHFKISEGIYSTGALRSFFGPEEQSLVINTLKGLIVLVGCSHPGVEKIIEKAREIGKSIGQEKIYAVIGGYHGFSNLDKLKEVELIGACHCTQYREEIKEKFPEQFKEINAGDVLEI